MTEHGPTGPRKGPQRAGYPVEGVLFDLGDTLLDEGRAFRDPEPLVPGVRGTLPRLASRYRLGILTNSVHDRTALSGHLDAWGIGGFFSAILSSADLGWEKPDRVAFEAGWTALGTRPGTTVMVGNNLAVDVAGARRAGLRTIFLRWSPRYPRVPRGTREEPTLSIDAFEALPGALERIVGHAPPRAEEGPEASGGSDDAV